MVEFAYAVGRIRALEVHLLDESHIIRMVDARDFESAYHVLRENPYYSEKIDRLPHAFDFEALLRQELSEVKELLENLAPKNEVLAAVWKKYEPEMTLDAYVLGLLAAAKKHPVRLFLSYAYAFVALYQLRKELLEGKLDPETAVNRFRYTDYYRAVSAGMEHYKKSGSLLALEREIDNQLMNIVKMAKYKAFGIEPLLGYAIAKEIEVKVLKLILTAKRMRVRTEEIKERLRLTYV